MYRLMIIAALRDLAIVRTTPTCCGEPMQRATGIGTNGWYCARGCGNVRT